MEWEVEVMLLVTAPSWDEAKAALERSGIRDGELIGEALVLGEPSFYLEIVDDAH